MFPLYCSEKGTGTKRSTKKPQPEAHSSLLKPFQLCPLPPPPQIQLSHLPKAKYISCYLDDTQSRALERVLSTTKMTVFRCQDNCVQNGRAPVSPSSCIQTPSLRSFLPVVVFLFLWEGRDEGWTCDFKRRVMQGCVGWGSHACVRFLAYEKSHRQRSLSHGRWRSRVGVGL